MHIAEIIEACGFDAVGECSTNALMTRDEVRDMCAAAPAKNTAIAGRALLLAEKSSITSNSLTSMKPAISYRRGGNSKTRSISKPC